MKGAGNARKGAGHWAPRERAGNAKKEAGSGAPRKRAGNGACRAWATQRGLVAASAAVCKVAVLPSQEWAARVVAFAEAARVVEATERVEEAAARVVAKAAAMVAAAKAVTVPEVAVAAAAAEEEVGTAVVATNAVSTVGAAAAARAARAVAAKATAVPWLAERGAMGNAARRETITGSLSGASARCHAATR